MTPNAIAVHFDTTRQAVSKHLGILTESLVWKAFTKREILDQMVGACTLIYIHNVNYSS